MRTVFEFPEDISKDIDPEYNIRQDSFKYRDLFHCSFNNFTPKIVKLGVLQSHGENMVFIYTPRPVSALEREYVAFFPNEESLRNAFLIIKIMNV